MYSKSSQAFNKGFPNYNSPHVLVLTFFSYDSLFSSSSSSSSFYIFFYYFSSTSSISSYSKDNLCFFLFFNLSIFSLVVVVFVFKSVLVCSNIYSVISALIFVVDSDNLDFFTDFYVKSEKKLLLTSKFLSSTQKSSSSEDSLQLSLSLSIVF